MVTVSDKNFYQEFKTKFDKAILKYNKIQNKITLIAVSKTQPVEKIKSVFNQGQQDFGENYVQEAIQKVELCKNLNINWHFIGSLQRNKVKAIVGKFKLIHSVESFSLAQKISQVASQMNIVQNCLLQVHIGDEESKGGFSENDLIQQIPILWSLPNIRWQGIMSMPPLTRDEQTARLYLQKTRSIFEKVKENISGSSQLEWQHLSMGTSHDFEWAIDEGATYIRVGTAIFGEREYPVKPTLMNDEGM